MSPNLIRPHVSVTLTSVTAVAAICTLAATWPRLSAYVTSTVKWGVSLRAETLASTTCQHLKAKLGSIITLPSEPSHANLTEENWSQSCWLPAACVARPSCAAGVQHLVTTLVAADVPFAIQSGGHSPSPYDASINATGVLIALDNLGQITYDPVTTLVTLSPGAR